MKKVKPCDLTATELDHYLGKYTYTIYSRSYYTYGLVQFEIENFKFQNGNKLTYVTRSES